MTEEDFVAAMRCLFQVWHGTENSDEILTDVVNTIGHQCFDKKSADLPPLVRRCRLSQRSLTRPAANAR